MDKDVLYVDDNEQVPKYLKWKSEGMKFQVIQARTAEEAISIMGNRKIAVVITSIHITEENDYSFLRTADTLFPDTVLIASTGRINDADVLAALNALNVYKILTKPWDIEGQILPYVLDALEYYELRCFKRELEKGLDEAGSSIREMGCDRLFQVENNGVRKTLGSLQDFLTNKKSAAEKVCAVAEAVMKKAADDNDAGLNEFEKQELIAFNMSAIQNYIQRQMDFDPEEESFGKRMKDEFSGSLIAGTVEVKDEQISKEKRRPTSKAEDCVSRNLSGKMRKDIEFIVWLLVRRCLMISEINGLSVDLRRKSPDILGLTIYLELKEDAVMNRNETKLQKVIRTLVDAIIDELVLNCSFFVGKDAVLYKMNFKYGKQCQ